MEKMTIQVLLVEDSPTDAKLLKQLFLAVDQQEWQITHVERLYAAIDISQKNPQRFDVVLLDLQLPDSNGLNTLKEYQQAIPEIPVVILTQLDEEDLALNAIAAGAQDYLVKDQVTIQRLLRAVRYAIKRGEILKKFQENAERFRLALAKEQEINELKSNFVAMVSHEFRKPMTLIRTAVEFIEYDNNKLTDERKTKYFDQIQNAINQMLQFLDEILFLSRTEAIKLEFNPVPINLQTFCHQVVEMAQMSTDNQQQIILTTQGESTQVKMDENLLNCIFTNLLSNAIKYSNPQSNIWFSLNCNDHTATFQVQDQGRGIPLKDQPRLFETFYRASNVGKIQGTGLGLAIVKKCVEAHGGEISLESQQDVGTTVTVILPLSQNNS
jgi:signal transduction histidine kinase